MTRLGAAAGLLGLGLAALGWEASWAPLGVLGAGMVLGALGALVYVVRRPRVALERAVEPPRVQKGLPAIAVVRAANLSRRTLAPLVIEQRLGATSMRAVLPRLRRGEAALRTYRLPTSARGIYEVGPIEISRADPFGLCRTVQRFGRPQAISVHPRLLGLRPLPTGVSRNLEGPSSDTSPQGSVTFHSLREYVVGDDLRTIHWPSTARLGKLVVRHNVDTAQPYTVVLLDLRPAVYSAECFEEAIDVAASVVTSMATGNAPVQLRTSTGDSLGGPGHRDPVPLVDHLTGVEPDQSGSFRAQLLRLRCDRGGTALVVVTGVLDPGEVPAIAALHRRFDRVLVLSITTRPLRAPAYPGLSVVAAPAAEEVARTWNQRLSR